MSVGDRSKRIRQRVLDRLGVSGMGNVSKEKVYRALDDVQLEAAEALLCLEAKWEIVVSQNEELVPFPPNFIAEKQLIPRSGTQELIRIDLRKKDRLAREYNAASNAVDASSGTVLYYYQWNENFGFLMSNGSAPSEDVEIDCYYWSTPDPTTDKLSDTKNPVIHRRFDRLLEYMATSEISGFPEDEARWLREMEKMETRVNQTNMDVSNVPNSRELD